MTAASALAGRRIVIVVAWAGMGGAERQALLLVEHLVQEAGARVEVVALTDDTGRFLRAVEELGVRWHATPLTWAGSRRDKALGLTRVAVRLRRLRPDALVSYCTRPNVISGLVWRAAGAHACVWNQQDVTRSTRFGPRLVTRAARSSSVLVASSEAARAFLVQLGAPPARVHVVPNTVELAAPVDDRATWRSRLGLDERVVAVTMLANFHRGKDHETLLRAWRAVLDRSSSPTVLFLAGRDAGAEDAAKAVAFDLDLGHGVRFLGEVSDVAGLLEASDVGVLSSRSESGPLALLECLAAGLPVAATDISGVREHLSDAQLKFLARTADAEGLANALLALISDPDLRGELGAANRRLALERRRVPAAPAIARLLTDALAR